MTSYITGFVSPFVSPRVEAFADTLVQLSVVGASSSVSFIYTFFDIASVGQNDHFRNKSVAMQEHCGVTCSSISQGLIKIINPNAKFSEWCKDLDKYDNRVAKGRIQKLPSHLHDIASKQQKIIDRLYLNGNFFERQIETSLFGLVSGVALAIVAVALTVFGAACTVFAMATFGCVEKINSYASNNIQTIGFAINQLHQGVLGFVAPSHIASGRKYPSDKNFLIHRTLSWAAVGAGGYAAYRRFNA